VHKQAHQKVEKMLRVSLAMLLIRVYLVWLKSAHWTSQWFGASKLEN